MMNGYRGAGSRSPLTVGRARGMLLAIALLLAAGALAVRAEMAPAAGPAGGSALLHDAGRLWAWADPELAGGAQAAAWSARWDARLTADEAASLAGALGLAAEPGGGWAGQADDGFRLTLWLAGEPAAADGAAGRAFAAPPASAAVLLGEGAAGADKRAVLAALERAERALAAAGADFRASVAFRGDALSGASAERIARAARAAEVERYDDAGTVSVAYASGQLRLAADSGGRRVNLQLAAHFDAAAGKWRLAGGTPLITGDYSG